MEMMRTKSVVIYNKPVMYFLHNWTLSANALVSDSRIEKSLSYAMMMYHNIAFATPLFLGYFRLA